MPSETASTATPAAATPVSGGGIAGRYAGALIALADDRIAADHSVLDRLAGDVAKLLAQLKGDANFRRFVADPRPPATTQAKVLADVATRLGLDPLSANFLRVLAANRRLSQLPAVLAAFEAQLAAKRGQVAAEVTTATALSDPQRAALTASLIQAGHANVRLVEKVDPALLGGLVVKIGSRLYDNSVRTKLQRLTYAMKDGAMKGAA
ncbi:MAG: F0F1 ATP synthase subunit delta [Acetobacteraceae bacterium]|nr:F0F1 ATP synthase subunit delta [Acetobacteraceae bacterium]